jgi:hypothetical protein
MTTCQKCGGEVQGWLCQGCGQAFREADGKLVFDHAAQTTFDGLVLVPREPTEAMLFEGCIQIPTMDWDRSDVKDAYAAMLSAAPPVDGWQPIETAPRDGTHFLAVDEAGDACRCAYHAHGYIMSFCGQPVVQPFEPISWMPWLSVPLPQPPNNERTG